MASKNGQGQSPETAVGAVFRELVAQEVDRADLDGLENKVMARIKNPRPRFPHGLLQLLKWPRIWAPAAAVVCMALAFFLFWPQSPQIPVPSALVQSFKGDIASVMILQTPQTLQTVVWYKETF